jgi:type I restriction enzyme M protein
MGELVYTGTVRAGRHRIGRSPWSVFLRIEELVLASSGADAFEVAYALVAARLYARRFAPAVTGSEKARLEELLGLARRAWPDLGVSPSLALPDATLSAVTELLDHAGLDGDAEGIDALFEQLVTRVGKGHKGQFFTPRHVVDFAIGALGLVDGERFVDPACGSGAFALHARAAAEVSARGWDIDARAVRVARLLALATESPPETFGRLDSLSRAALHHAGSADVVATNPPFAGRADAAGFEVAKLGGGSTVERDALFLERCLAWLVPGGRLAIVLPHGKVASPGWSRLRTWLVARARVLAVVSLPGETFRPHTSQRTVLLFARKRARGERPRQGERVFFGVSERAGTDASGEPILVRGARRASWRDRDHDLASLAKPLRAFLASEGFSPRKVSS